MENNESAKPPETEVSGTCEVVHHRHIECHKVWRSKPCALFYVTMPTLVVLERSF